MPINAFQMQVTIPYFTGVPTDVITNVWSLQFTTLAPTGADWLAAQTRFQTFYASVYNNTNFQCAPWVRPALTRWKGYDLNDPSPRAPRYQATAAITVTATASCTVTPETAVCLSFQGTQVSGTSQARRRGRIFLGGLGTATDNGSASIFPATKAAAVSAVAVAASTLKTGLAADGWTWSILSRTDNAMVTVNNGWIDNAPDTQRRRGQAPTSRTLFS